MTISIEEALRVERDNLAMRLDQATARIEQLKHEVAKLQDEVVALEDEIDSAPAKSDLQAVGAAVRIKDWETAAEFLWRCGVPGF